MVGSYGCYRHLCTAPELAVFSLFQSIVLKIVRLGLSVAKQLVNLSEMLVDCRAAVMRYW